MLSVMLFSVIVDPIGKFCKPVMRISVMLMDQGFRVCRKIYMDSDQKINPLHFFAIALVSSSWVRINHLHHYRVSNETTWALHYFQRVLASW